MLSAELAGPDLDIRLLVDHRERLVRGRASGSTTRCSGTCTISGLSWCCRAARCSTASGAANRAAPGARRADDARSDRRDELRPAARELTRRSTRSTVTPRRSTRSPQVHRSQTQRARVMATRRRAPLIWPPRSRPLHGMTREPACYDPPARWRQGRPDHIRNGRGNHLRRPHSSACTSLARPEFVAAPLTVALMQKRGMARIRRLPPARESMSSAGLPSACSLLRPARACRAVGRVLRSR